MKRRKTSRAIASRTVIAQSTHDAPETDFIIKDPQNVKGHPQPHRDFLQLCRYYLGAQLVTKNAFPGVQEQAGFLLQAWQATSEAVGTLPTGIGLSPNEDQTRCVSRIPLHNEHS